MASYDANCGACHGFGTSSTKAGATVTRINDGIVNVPSMNSLSSLSVDEIQAIADYLATIVPPPPPPPPPGPIDGMASYDANCGACHG
jgi:mono/diheme cytochrome c family protein